jgi:hypothetical protein
VRFTDFGPVILGGPNCFLLASTEVLLWNVPAGGATGSRDLFVPSDPVLLGLKLYQQWWLFYTVTCPLGPDHYLFMTNGGALTIGN